MDFVRINNRKAFLISEIPDYHPATVKYKQFWSEQKKRCIEGFWTQDTTSKTEKGMWRYMTGALYFYVNFATILHNPEEVSRTAAKVKMRPYLRDVEWEFFYNLLECGGFSGFENDETYTCCRDVLDPDDVPRIHPSCYNPKGKLKIYKPARDYIRQLHDKNLGLPLYHNSAKNLFVLATRGCGKDLIHNTIIYTEHGRKEIKDISVGDKIYGRDGKLTNVISKDKYTDQEQYKVILSDKREVICGGGHLWGVYRRKGKKYIYEVKELNEIKKDYKIGKRGDSRYFIPQNEPIQYIKKEYFVDPYVIGSILGDGGITQNKITFTTADIESVNEINSLLKEEYSLHKIPSSKYSYTLRRENHNGKWKNIYIEELKRLGLMNHHTRDKFIPKEYLHGNIEQRISLLQGLLDTDGWIGKQGQIEFSTISHRLAEDFCELSRSLGIVINKRYTGYCYRITLKTSLCVFRLKRKIDRIISNPSKYAITNRNKLAIRKIENTGVHNSYCIGVDNNDKLFLVNDFVVTHNSYTTAIGVVLHEILFDGAKVYNKESRENPAEVEVFVGAGLSSKSSDMLHKTRMAMEFLPGAWAKDSDRKIPSPLYKTMAGTLRPNNVQSPWIHRYKKKIGGRWEFGGTGSNVKHGTYTIENPEAAVGTRPTRMIIEEVGILQNVIAVHGACEACMTEGTNKFGFSVFIGTSGNMDKIIESEIMFRDPESYDMLAFDDEWEDSGKIGWFIPAYYGLNQYKDENGNTDVKAAKAYLEKKRKKKKHSGRSQALDNEMMYFPVIPSEMFLTRTNSKLPIADLKHRLGELLSKKELLSASWKGELILKEGKPEWDNREVIPIREFPLKDLNNLKGCIEVYNPPVKNPDGTIAPLRYILACLPPGEKVITEHGLKNIEDVKFDDKLINEKGDQVDIKKLIRHNVTNEDIYTLRPINTLRATTFTSEHPILISKNKFGYVSYPKAKRLNIPSKYPRLEFEYITPDKIEVNDWTKVPNIYNEIKEVEFNNYWDNSGYRVDRIIDNPLYEEDFWWFVGAFLGDGWTCKNGYQIELCFNTKETYYINKFISICKRLFKRTPSVLIKNGATKVTICFQQLNSFMKANFGVYSYGKFIPEWVKYLDPKCKKQLILGYLDSDGSIMKHKRGNYHSMEFVSINLELLESIQDIIFSLGVVSSLSKLRNESKRVFRGTDKESNCKKTYHLRLSHLDCIALAEILDDKNDLKIKRIELKNLKKTRRRPKNGCFISEDLNWIYFQIKDIKKESYTGEVYNFECETNTFLCHHITTHNCDPVDDDMTDDGADYKRSLQSTFVFDTFTDRIVAEYTGRTRYAKEYYEQVRRLALYYDGRILYENQKKGLFTYFENKNCVYLLEDTPIFLKDNEMQNLGIGNKAKGIYVNPAIKNFGMDLYLQWLEDQAEGADEGITNLNLIRSVGLLRESIIYNDKINADRISSFLVLMIYRESRVKISDSRKVKVKEVSEDPFWDRHFPLTDHDPEDQELADIMGPGYIDHLRRKKRF